MRATPRVEFSDLHPEFSAPELWAVETRTKMYPGKRNSRRSMVERGDEADADAFTRDFVIGA
jgi:hypothetical protein